MKHYDLEVYVMDPAGNVTILVETPVKKEDYAAVANALMAEIASEQVGFITPPQKDGQGRLEMMGGEFCGNATRAFGYYLGTRQEPLCRQVKVEISGTEAVLEVRLDPAEGKSWAQMPLPLCCEKMTALDGTEYDVIAFDGITHIIIEGKPQSEAFVRDIISRSGSDADACGVMFLEDHYMTPVVYVKETDTLIWESSCGSGTMAAAVSSSLNRGDGTFGYKLVQPGGMLEATVTCEGGKIRQCTMGGSIKIRQNCRINVNVPLVY